MLSGSNQNGVNQYNEWRAGCFRTQARTAAPLELRMRCKGFPSILSSWRSYSEETLRDSSSISPSAPSVDRPEHSGTLRALVFSHSREVNQNTFEPRGFLDFQ